MESNPAEQPQIPKKFCSNCLEFEVSWQISGLCCTLKCKKHSFTSRHACSVVFLTSKYAAVFVSVFTFLWQCILVAQQADADTQFYSVQPDKQSLSKFLSCINIFSFHPTKWMIYIYFFLLLLWTETSVISTMVWQAIFSRTVWKNDCPEFHNDNVFNQLLSLDICYSVSHLRALKTS